MAFEQLLPLHNMNFQMNRVLTHGAEACRKEELLEIAPKLRRFDPKAWFEQWNTLARRAEAEGRLMHAAYYHRMSEFFLPEDAPEKANAYEAFSRCFYAAAKDEKLEVFTIPYEGTSSALTSIGGVPPWPAAAASSSPIASLRANSIRKISSRFETLLSGLKSTWT